MFKLDPSGLTQSRQGYLFAYAQVTFNQFRRYANLVQDKERSDAESTRLQDRIAAGELPSASELAPLGWRSFTLEFEQQAELLECRILAVVASALFLEAYMFDYCARRESATFARKYVDRLDPVAKWVVIPRLIAPPGLDTGSHVVERLRRLFQLRNDLVHHKTQEAASFEQPPDFPADMNPNDCLQVVIDSLRALQSIDAQDEFGAFVLRHIASWAKYTAKDSRFYPVLWEA